MTTPSTSNSQSTPSKTDESRDPPCSIGEGSSGPIYLATYNRRKVAIRVYPKTKSGLWKNSSGLGRIQRDSHMGCGSGEEGHFLAEHLIARLTDPHVAKIPARFINRHPFFWSDDLKLDYIQAVSEKIKSVKFPAPEHHLLQLGSDDVMQRKFHAQLCPDILQEALTGHYKTERVSDVLRLMRNFKAHYYEHEPPVSTIFAPEPIKILEYFERKFPKLLTFVFKATQYLGYTQGFGKFFPREIALHSSAKDQHSDWNKKNPKRI